MTEPAWKDKWPTVAILCGCIPLQRFAIPLGGFKLPLVVPIVVCVFAILAIRRRLVMSKQTLLWYSAFSAYGVCCAWFSTVFPPRGMSTSLFSYGYLVLAYLFLAFRMRAPLGLVPTLSIFRGFLCFIAICACLQFGLQFVGIHIIRFKGILPDAILCEDGYNLAIPLWIGATNFRSNGMFLLEPSLLSQFMAVGLVVELLYFGNQLRMALLVVAMLLSFSGTGFLVLGFAMAAGSLIEPRSFMKVGRFALIGAGTAALLAGLAAPKYVSTILARTSEISSEHTSGFIRFISPFLVVKELADDPRFLLGFGPGTAERVSTVAYEYNLNVVVKVLIEYGLPGLLFYAMLIKSACYRPESRALSATALFWFVSGGCYFLTPTIIYSLAVLLTWGPAPSTQRHRRPPALQAAQVRGYPFNVRAWQ